MPGKSLKPNAETKRAARATSRLGRAIATGRTADGKKKKIDTHEHPRFSRFKYEKKNKAQTWKQQIALAADQRRRAASIIARQGLYLFANSKRWPIRKPTLLAGKDGSELRSMLLRS